MTDWLLIVNLLLNVAILVLCYLNYSIAKAERDTRVGMKMKLRT